MRGMSSVRSRSGGTSRWWGKRAARSARSAAGSRQVAAMTRMSARVGRASPSRWISPESSRRSSWACRGCGSSPISSTSRVPPSASPARPRRGGHAVVGVVADVAEPLGLRHARGHRRGVARERGRPRGPRPRARRGTRAPCPIHWGRSPARGPAAPRRTRSAAAAPRLRALRPPAPPRRGRRTGRAGPRARPRGHGAAGSPGARARRRARSRPPRRGGRARRSGRRRASRSGPGSRRFKASGPATRTSS